MGLDKLLQIINGIKKKGRAIDEDWEEFDRRLEESLGYKENVYKLNDMGPSTVVCGYL